MGNEREMRDGKRGTEGHKETPTSDREREGEREIGAAISEDLR